jgi:two-component system cell cycle response regulator DivK
MPKILLAEDDEFSRDMLTRRLERQGYEVVTAADGREALLAARQSRPDLILMDLDMPVLDGHAAMRSLKTDPRTARIPIIVLTAHASPQSVAEAVEAGCYSYEAKPVVVRRLVERIQEALGSVMPTATAGENAG